MENKLEHNMYVRLNCNYELGIGKTIGEIDKDNFIKTKFKDGFECSVPMYMILKASYNIIDILEVGDYVNGHEVKSKQSGVKRIDIGEDENYVWLNEKDIKSVITHEQMEQMAYKVGD